MNRANILLFQSTDSSKFVTLFACVLKIDEDKITYVNAGHNDPLLITSKGEIKKLNEGGLLLGCMPMSTYSEAVIKLNVGDLVVVFSDGITEAMNESEEEYGDERLEKLLPNLMGKQTK